MKGYPPTVHPAIAVSQLQSDSAKDILLDLNSHSEGMQPTNPFLSTLVTLAISYQISDCTEAGHLQLFESRLWALPGTVH